mmetsp:Transcript_44843/g.71985  ORF Transcript_44843/g.71985 Transcript_44843/m.71985 type:complete len:250 (-) Transcript_44843:108-857(-)
MVAAVVAPRGVHRRRRGRGAPVGEHGASLGAHVLPLWVRGVVPSGEGGGQRLGSMLQHTLGPGLRLHPHCRRHVHHPAEQNLQVRASEPQPVVQEIRRLCGTAADLSVRRHRGVLSRNPRGIDSSVRELYPGERACARVLLLRRPHRQRLLRHDGLRKVVHKGGGEVPEQRRRRRGRDNVGLRAAERRTDHGGRLGIRRRRCVHRRVLTQVQIGARVDEEDPPAPPAGVRWDLPVAERQRRGGRNRAEQ